MSHSYKGSVRILQLLTLPEKEKTEATNKPYGIKTFCWVKDNKRGFLAGEIQSGKDNKVMMKIVINQLSSTLWVQQDPNRSIGCPQRKCNHI